MTSSQDGNPSCCSIATATNANANGGVVCTCAEGFAHISLAVPDSVGAGDRGSSDARSNSHGGGYLCQRPIAAVIVPQTIATLRSKYIIHGPPEQLARAQSGGGDPVIHNLGFFWNGYNIDPSEITVSVHWLNDAVAELDWVCKPNSTCDGAGNIVINPSPSTPDSVYLGSDRAFYPNGYPEISYFVNTTGANDTSLTSAERRATIQVVYSAFHLPGRFDHGVKVDKEQAYAVPVVAARKAHAPRTLRIDEKVTTTNDKNNSIKKSKYEWLPTTANVSVSTNDVVPTSVTFQLTNNTCYEQHGAYVLDVRRIAYTAATDAGWEIVVGLPEEMAKAAATLYKGTMQPCTALLQACDSVTHEVLDITMIEASVQDCFESSNPAANPASLSCTGHGTCKRDPNPYDGIFQGCVCSLQYAGKHCDVPMISCPLPNEAFNVDEGTCKTFRPVFEPLHNSIPTVRYTLAGDLNTTAPFVEEDTVHIAGVQLNPSKSEFSAGGASQVKFLLSDTAPTSFFVSSATGEISAYLTIPPNATAEPYSYDFQLLAQDALGATATVRRMQFRVKRKRLPIAAIVLSIAVVVAVVVSIQKLHQHRLARKDARAALARARKAYGLADPTASDGSGGSGNTGNGGGFTANTSFVGSNASDSADYVLLLDPGAEADAGGGYNNDHAQPIYEDDASSDDDYAVAEVDESAQSSALGSPPPITGSSKWAEKKRRRKMLSKFVAPTINLGKSTLAAKGLDVLLGVDPKTYMHVKNKEQVILKEFAKNGTDEDKRNLKTLLDGTYRNPGQMHAQPQTIEDLMACSDVEDAGLERHHVLALRLYTTSTFSSINSPMRKSPPVLPHPFAATLYYISDAICKLREVQGKDPARRNASLVFWRGMRDLQMTDEFITHGGSEMACMSTTSSREVAQDFALSKSPLLFKFVSNSFMSHGADISFLSVYPHEKEVVYPPLTYLRPIRITEETIGGIVYKVVEVEPIFPK